MVDSPRLLATDLDGTLVGRPEALSRLVGLLSARPGDWKLAYVTGRSLASARALAAAERLPMPDVWVTEVGSLITDADGTEDAAWCRRIGADWNRLQVARLANGFAELEPQPSTGQGPFKVSYYLKPEHAEAVLPALAARLRGAGFKARLVYSSERDLDILPERAGKGEAVRYVAERLGVPLTRVLTCGDSGNDHDMLGLGCPAVAVGNAQPELLGRLPETVYKARGHCAEGILEAIEHYRWLAVPVATA